MNWLCKRIAGTHVLPDIECPGCEIDRLRTRLRDQTAQAQETAQYIHDKVVETLERHEVIPDGHHPCEHPTEQVVGTCVSVLKCEIEALQELVINLRAECEATP